MHQAIGAAPSCRWSTRSQDSLLDEAGEVREALGPLLLALEEQALCLCATKKAGGETYYRLVFLRGHAKAAQCVACDTTRAPPRRFDESRALAWLGCKVRALASSLGGLELYAGFAEQQLTALCINLLEEYVEGHWTRRPRAQVGLVITAHLPSVARPWNACRCLGTLSSAAVWHGGGGSAITHASDCEPGIRWGREAGEETAHRPQRTCPVSWSGDHCRRTPSRVVALASTGNPP